MEGEGEDEDDDDDDADSEETLYEVEYIICHKILRREKEI